MNSQNPDDSIILAAQALMSLAPQPATDYIVHDNQPSSMMDGTFYPRDANTATTPSMMMVNDDTIHYVTATPSSISNMSENYCHHWNNNNTPMIVSTTTTTATTTTGGYPKILNVPRSGNSNSCMNSCASSLDDGIDNHSQTSSTSSTKNIKSLQQPRMLPRINHINYTNDNDVTTIAYRPQEITSYYCNNNDDSNTTFIVDTPKKTNAVVTKKYPTNKKIAKAPKKVSSIMKQGLSSGTSKSNVTSHTADPATTTTFYEGSVSLRLKEDEFSLSPLHCFMRQFCVEAFTASSEEVTTPRYGKSHGRSISIGQVGIQCVYCKHRPYWLRQERAVCFPSTLKNIYHSIETWQRRHSIVCTDIPLWAKDKMTKLMGKSRSGAGGRRQYWEESATQLGMVDTPTGIRFIRPPGSITALITSAKIESIQESTSNDSTDGTASTVSTDEEMTKMSMNTPFTASSSMVGVESTSTDSIRIGGKPVVLDKDRELVTDFLFTLLNQMETCYFSEQDRIGGRSKVKDCPTGYPGLQCKHCGGKAGFGRYYPISIQALTSANSDRNIYNHVEKCRRCPSYIREQLEQHLNDQIVTKNRRGNRKEFFQRIWVRMHGPSAAEIGDAPSITRQCTDDDTDIDDVKEPVIKQSTIFHHQQKQQQQQHQQQKPEQSWRQPSNDSTGPMAVVSSNAASDHRFHQRVPQRQPNIYYKPYNGNPSQQPIPPASNQFFGQQTFQQIHQRFQERPDMWQQQQQQQHQRQHNVFLQPSHQSIRNSTLPFYSYHNQK